MSEIKYLDLSQFLHDNLRLRTFPVAVKLLDAPVFPDKTVRPKSRLGKKITICMGVSMARMYGWTVGLAKEDIVCVPAMISFGFTGAKNQVETVGKLFCEVSFSKDRETGQNEASQMSLIPSKQIQALLIAPLNKAGFEPDSVAIYGNPAQIMRLVQAWTYLTGERVTGLFGGKVECTEYLTAPIRTGKPRVAIPGGGDRIFSMTQDDEMVFSLPASGLQSICDGLKLAGKKIGAKYPITFYQNFQPEFPPYYKTLAKELNIDQDQ